MNAEINIQGVVLETERLVLREWKLSDVKDLYEYASVPGVGEKAGWSHHESLSESKAILKRFMEGKKTFALELKSTQKVIGSLGIESLRHDEFDQLYGRELGYVLSKEHWNQGLMSEAVAKVIDWCFHDLKLDILVCCSYFDNVASRRVQEKNGFQPYKKIELSSVHGLKWAQMNVLKRGELK